MHNILPILFIVLKQNIQQDSVNGRIFRIIGNICQHVERLSTLIIEKQPTIVDSIVSFLKSTVNEDLCDITKKNSIASINMGIRALRYVYSYLSHSEYKDINSRYILCY